MEIKVILVPDGTDEDGLPTFDSLNDALVDAASHHLKGFIEKLAAGLVTDATHKAIEDRAKAMVDDLATKPVQETDSYGNPKGEPKALVELVMVEVNKWLTQTVDTNGRLHPYSDGITRVAQIAKSAAEQAAKATMKAHAEAFAAEFRQAWEAKAEALLAARAETGA